jgi:hypothetical protein
VVDPQVHAVVATHKTRTCVNDIERQRREKARLIITLQVLRHLWSHAQRGLGVTNRR